MSLKPLVEYLRDALKKELPGSMTEINFRPQYQVMITDRENAFTKSSSVLILLYSDQNEIYFPLIKRPNYEGKHGGQIGLPGGKVEKEDENLTRTALREAQEEIGIKAIDVRILGCLSKIFVPVSNYKVQPVVGYIEYKPGFFPDPFEVEYVLPAKLSQIRGDITNRMVEVGGMKIEVPGFEVEGHWVWGATAIILGELREILKMY